MTFKEADCFSVRSKEYMKTRCKTEQEPFGKLICGDIITSNSSYTIHPQTSTVVVIKLPCATVGCHIVLQFNVSPDRDEAAELFLKDEFQRSRFKILIKVIDAPTRLAHMIPQKPAYANKMLSIVDNESGIRTYTLDTSISPIARRIMPYIWRNAHKFIVDIGFVIEGQHENELPERPFATARIEYPNMSEWNKSTCGTFLE